MAKGSAMGLWRGKKGSSVFYKIKNSNSAQKQGIRERVYEVANPQSNKQCSQRMKMLPAQMLYNSIKSVIERSWQGVKYGEMSRQAFLKKALSDTAIVPFLTKGSSKAAPGTYQISKGSMREYHPEINGNMYINSGLLVPTSYAASLTTIGELTDALLARPENGLQSGDQVTFVACQTIPDGTNDYIFDWNIYSFYLNSEDETSVADVFGNLSSDFAPESGKMFIGSPKNVCAFAVVASREGSTPQRNNATLVLDADFAETCIYYTEMQRLWAIRSYRVAKAKSTDWPADPNGQGESGGGVTYYDINVTTNPEGAASLVSGGGRITEGTQVTLTARNGVVGQREYTFVQWEVNGQVLSNQANYTFTPISNLNIVAKYTVAA